MKKIFSRYEKWLQFLKKKKLFSYSLDDVIVKFVLALVLVIVITSMLPSERPFEYSNLTVGSIAQNEIIAPFDFPIIKSEETLEKERREAMLSVPPVFNRVGNIYDIQKLKIRNLFEEFSLFCKTAYPLSRSKSTARTKQYASLADSVIQQISLKYNLKLSPSDLKQLCELEKKRELKDFLEYFLNLLHTVFQEGIINIPVEQIEEGKVTFIQNGIEEIYDANQILDEELARQKVLTQVKKRYAQDSFEFAFAQKLLNTFLVPNLILDEQETKKRKDKAVHDVPTTSGFVYKNQRIVDSHEIVTQEIYQKLRSLAIALKERSSQRGGFYHFLFLLGEYIFSFLVVLVLGLYIYYYRPKLFRDNKLLLLITTVLLLQFFLAILVGEVLRWNYTAIPITVAPMLLSMLLDAPIAFIGTVITSVVIGASQGNNFYLSLMTFIVGTIALFSVQKIRNRGQMFRAMLYITLGYALVNFSHGFVHYEPFSTMVKMFFFYQVPNAILAPTAIFLLIGVFERFFDVTTDITLLELSDLNHPLLKKLSVEAPGTFHHSIIVGNLAEAAAKEVGANSLLARVGCYYHDIGKMVRPEYFVENQSGTVSKHENLTPTMSALILVQHVKAGLELAEQYKLPRAVKQFIPEHHGTSLMEYFYQKAREVMNPKDINEADFRYPGPKPQSKETAIAMLADTIEAAARSLTNPTPQRIRTLVENLIQKRFQEGQLDECDLTLRDLNRIKEAFIPILMGIHHIRIEYPGESKEEKSEKDRKSTAVKDNGKAKEAAQSSGEENSSRVPATTPHPESGDKKKTSLEEGKYEKQKNPHSNKPGKENSEPAGKSH